MDYWTSTREYLEVSNVLNEFFLAIHVAFFFNCKGFEGGGTGLRVII